MRESMMNMNPVKEKYLDIFRHEWEMYKTSGHENAQEKGRFTSDGNFDLSIMAGEIRLFADVGRILVGLLYKEWGEKYWIIVPVSPFTVPATEQEILIGKRVYQIWNTFTASIEVVEKSWRVDTLSPLDLKDLEMALLHVMVGDPLRDDLEVCMGPKIISTNDVRLDYEREFVMQANVDTQLAKGKPIHPVFKYPLFPIEFLRSRMKKLRGRGVIPEDRLAAASNDADSQVFMWRVENSFEDEIVKCSLLTEFRALYPGADPYKLVFAISGDPTASFLKATGRVAVEARDRKSCELVGTGFYDPGTKEITIETVPVNQAIEKLNDMILVTKG